MPRNSLTKQEIKIKLESKSLWDLENPIDDVIEFFQKIRTQYSEYNYEKIIIDVPYAYDGDTSFYIYGVRMETDEEEQRREQNEKEHQQRVQENKRKQYEELRKEFENT